MLFLTTIRREYMNEKQQSSNEQPMGELTRLTSRKFIISILLIVSSTILAGIGKIDGDNYMVVVSIVAAGYGVTNVMNKRRIIEERKVD